MTITSTESPTSTTATHEWHAMTPEKFWRTADDYQEQALENAQRLFQLARTTDRDVLSRLLIGYRLFTAYYIPDLAILVARLDDGPIRSFLADILDDELGRGDPALAHPRLYDDFLASFGLDPEESGLALPRNICALDAIRDVLTDPARDPVVGVGLRGMGGECVCQVYLSEFYEHMSANAVFVSCKDRLDLRFWDLHVGEHDAEHHRETRRLIDEALVSRSAIARQLLGEGYEQSMSSWQQFWVNIVDWALSPELHQPVPHGANYRPPETSLPMFHLAIGVDDLEVCRKFYVEVLGATEARHTSNNVDLDLAGHHVVLHHTSSANDDGSISDFHGELVPIPHFGLNLARTRWEELRARIQMSGRPFLQQPHRRLVGMVGEHDTMFLQDPAGNSLEFKSFIRLEDVFATDLGAGKSKLTAAGTR